MYHNFCTLMGGGGGNTYYGIMLKKKVKVLPFGVALPPLNMKNFDLPPPPSWGYNSFKTGKYNQKKNMRQKLRITLYRKLSSGNSHRSIKTNSQPKKVWVRL